MSSIPPLPTDAILRALVDSSDDAIVSKTLDGIITSWNRGAERIFGWTAAEAVGRHITLIVPEDLRAEVGRMDPMHVPSRGFDEKVTGAQLIDFAKEAEAGGGMAVYLFHGVGGDYLQVSDSAHRQLIAWLAAHRSEVWVTTLQGALDWAKAHANPQH